MNIPSNRQPENTPRAFIGDAICHPYATAQDQSEPYGVQPVRPSIPQDHRDRKDAASCTGYTLGLLDAAEGIIYQMARMLTEAGICEWPVKIDSTQAELGPRVKIERTSNHYKVSPRPNTAGS